MTDEALAENTSALWTGGTTSIINNLSQYAGKYDAATLQSRYNNCAFDKATSWSANFLSKLKVNPGPFWNPSLENNTK